MFLEVQDLSGSLCSCCLLGNLGGSFLEKASEWILLELLEGEEQRPEQFKVLTFKRLVKSVTL